MLLLLHFLEAARRFGESEVSLTLDGPLVALVAEHGLATSVEGDSAVADFTVALGAELKVELLILFSFFFFFLNIFTSMSRVFSLLFSTLNRMRCL